MQRVFIGTEAVAAGDVTKYQLRAHYERVFPDVYACTQKGPLCIEELAFAAFLWSGRRAVVSDVVASALHGAKWVDTQTPIELNHPNNKSPQGIITRFETLLDDELQIMRGLPVTTLQRTAFDLARHGTVRQAVARLDALANATQTRFNIDDVLALVPRHGNLSGIRRVDGVLDMVDGGAQSPKETWLRLLLVEAGFPRPRTQIPVLGVNGQPRYYLDMGWEEVMITVEYDGEHHRTSRDTYANDIIRSDYIRDVGWWHIRVVAGHRPSEIVAKTRRAWSLRQNSAR